MSNAVIFEDVQFMHEGKVILSGINATVESGEIFFVLGPNGSGKTILAKIAAGLLTPTGGKISLMGTSAHVSTRRFELGVRKQIGFIPQTGGLISNRTVFENLSLKAMFFEYQTDQETLRKIIQPFAEKFEIDQYYDTFPNFLSPGIQKRVMIVRAMITHTPILIIDSLSQDLDQLQALRTLALLKEVQQSNKFTLILFSSFLEPELEISNRFAVLNNGKLETIATTKEELYKDKWIVEIAKAGKSLGRESGMLDTRTIYRKDFEAKMEQQKKGD